MKLNSCTEMVTTGKVSCFILSERSDFDRVNNFPIAVHVSLIRTITPLSLSKPYGTNVT